MLYKTEVIVTTFIVCTIVVVILLKLAYVPFTLYWLLPVAGGMLVGVSAASLRRISRRSSPPRRLGREYLEPSVQLGLGIAFLIIGYLTV